MQVYYKGQEEQRPVTTVIELKVERLGKTDAQLLAYAVQSKLETITAAVPTFERSLAPLFLVSMEGSMLRCILLGVLSEHADLCPASSITCTSLVKI